MTLCTSDEFRSIENGVIDDVSEDINNNFGRMLLVESLLNSCNSMSSRI